MEFLKRILAVIVFNVVAVAYTGQTNALTERRSGPDSRMYFKLNQISSQVYDYQQFFNESNQTLRVQMGLVLIDADSAVKEEYLSVVKAPLGQLVFLDYPEYLEGCDEIVQQQFEYAPGLQTYLLMLTLKGSECRRKSLLHHQMHLRVRFDAIPVSNSQIIPVALEVLSSQR